MTRAERAALKELEDWAFGQLGPHSLEAIAERLGISAMGVLNIERRALAKMRALTDDDWQGPLTNEDRVGYVEGTGSIVRRSGNSRSRPTTKLRK